jgi:hypothetical protein
MSRDLWLSVFLKISSNSFLNLFKYSIIYENNPLKIYNAASTNMLFSELTNSKTRFSKSYQMASSSFS